MGDVVLTQGQSKTILTSFAFTSEISIVGDLNKGDVNSLTGKQATL